MSRPMIQDCGVVREMNDAEMQQAATDQLEASRLDRTVPETISQRQFMQWLASSGLITFDEAEAYLGAGMIPHAFTVAIEKLPAEMQPAARLKFVGAATFSRHDQLTVLMGPLMEPPNTPADLDAIWVGAASLD